MVLLYIEHAVQLMGFNQSGYPYLYLIQNDTEYFNTQILKGVNFASGGAGIVENVGEVRFVSFSFLPCLFHIYRCNFSNFDKLYLG